MKFDMQPIIMLITTVVYCANCTVLLSMTLAVSDFREGRFPMRIFCVASLIIVIVGTMLCYIVHEGLHVSS